MSEHVVDYYEIPERNEGQACRRSKESGKGDSSEGDLGNGKGRENSANESRILLSTG